MKSVTYDLLAAFKDKLEVGLIQRPLSPEISLLDALPDLLALASTTDQWTGLGDKLIDLGLWVVREGGERGSWTWEARGAAHGHLVHFKLVGHYCFL